MNNIFEKTIKTLTNDVDALQNKYHYFVSKGDTKGAIDTLRLIKDSLSLIKEYDWKQMYSEYEIDNHKQISIWEQNHCGEIRNHKVWSVNETNKYDCNRWYTYFRDSILSKSSLILTNGHLHRDTGKTYAIAKLCKEYNGLIAYKINASLKGIENTNIKGIRNHFINFDDLRGRKNELIFIDECSGLSDTDIDYLKKYNTVIGFLN